VRNARWLTLASVGLVAACSEPPPANSSAGTSVASSSGSGGAGGSGFQARCRDGFCLVPAGTFVMGSPEDEFGRGANSEDQVQVTLTRSFVLQQLELTQEQWVRFGWANPSGTMGDGTGDCIGPSCPVGRLTWFEAVAYANELSKASGLPPCYQLSDCDVAPGGGMRCGVVGMTEASVYSCTGFRLPTEAEWEYAARAGTTTAFYSGGISPQSETGTCFAEPNLENIAWYCNNAGPLTHPGGGKLPNPWGFHDMLGNTQEWVHNDYHGEGHGTAPLTDPLGEMNPSEEARVFKGGGWNSWGSLLRAASHLNGPWTGKGPGLRLARTLAPGETW